MKKEVMIVVMLSLLLLIGCATKTVSESINDELIEQNVPVMDIVSTELLLGIQVDGENIPGQFMETKVLEILQIAGSIEKDKDVLIMIENFENRKFGFIFDRQSITSYLSGKELSFRELQQTVRGDFSVIITDYTITKSIEEKGYPVEKITRQTGGFIIPGVGFLDPSEFIQIHMTASERLNDDEILNLFNIILDNSKEDYLEMKISYDNEGVIEQKTREGLNLYFEGSITREDLSKYSKQTILPKG